MPERKREPTLEEVVEASAIEALDNGKVYFPLEPILWDFYKHDVESILQKALSRTRRNRIESTSGRYSRRFAQAVVDIITQSRKRGFRTNLVVHHLEGRANFGVFSEGIIIYRRDQIPRKELFDLNLLYNYKLPKTAFLY